MKNYLNFENEVKNLENELEKLKDPFNQSGLSEVDTQKISRTQNELEEKLRLIYSKVQSLDQALELISEIMETSLAN